MTDYTQVGKEMADRLFTNQGWKRGIGVQRLCNELGELRARLDAADPAKVAARFAALEQKIADLERRLDRMDEYQQEQNEQS